MRFVFLFLLFSSLAAELPLPKGAKADWGFLPFYNKEGKEAAEIFFISYTQKSDDQKPRPITFCFNGGPGSASVWLHLGGVGPLRIKNGYESGELESNPGSILPFTDLVFLDPVSTGLSKIKPDIEESSFYSYERDADSMRQAVTAYLNKFQRWSSPIYLMGESYGALRIVGIAKKLFDNDFVAANGLIFVSGPLDLGTITGESTHDLPYVAAFPTQAIIAGLKRGEQPEKVAQEAEKFLEQTYQPALFLGNALPHEQREPLAEALNKWTSIPKSEIVASFYRITPTTFNYMFDRGQVLGRFDGRVSAKAPYEIPPYIAMEPSFHPLYAPFQQAMHEVLTELGWKSQGESYIVLSSSVNSKWDWKTQNCFLNVIGPLKGLLYQIPKLEVLSCNGYYDLSVPYYSVKYSLRHLLLDEETASRVKLQLFHGGHMFYLDRSVNEAFRDALKKIYP